MRFLFGDYSLDAARRELCRRGESVPVEPQVFDLLLNLIEHRDRVVTKDDLLVAVWQGRVVSESTLSNRINAARQAIGDSGEAQRLIRTVARRGFRFVGDVRETPSGTGQDAGAGTAEGSASAAGDAQPMGGAEPGLALPEKPSIAVLPFANMSDDPQQEYFADGMAEEIITALSHNTWLFVIARNSSFTYRGRAVDVRQVGRDLGVRYVLEGSVRKAGNRLRVAAQLIDATDGHHVWAERYERALEDLFAVQDDITHNILGAIAPGIVAAEIRRTQGKGAAELGPWERLMRAHWHVRRFTRADCDEAIRLIDELLRLQPNNAMALADLAYTLHFAAAFAWSDSPAEAFARMGEAARRAVASDDLDAAAHTSLGLHELFSNRNDDAIRRLRRAIELDPNSSFARGNLGVAYAFSGASDPAIQALQEAMRLSPRDFLMVIWYTASAWAHLSAERLEQAADCGQRAIDCNPAFPDGHGTLAAASAHLGRAAEARAALEGYMRLLPGLTAADDRLVRPFRRSEDRERFVTGLRKAGLPES
jgi:TolB-like protein/Flp pilus assembly protein TadD